jgi:hypothetical protein
MTAGFNPPADWTETASQLRTSGRATLNAAGTAAISFSPDSANQRWVVTQVVVSTNQLAVATTYPFVTLALNTTDINQMSQGNQRGTTFSGNSDTYTGAVDVGPCDFLSLLFYPPPGSSGAQIAALSGVLANAVLLGTKYTRRR